MLFVAEAYTRSVLRHYEDSLAAAVSLAFFIPLLIGTGGNPGSQNHDHADLAAGRWDQRVVFRELDKWLDRFVAPDPSLTIEQMRYPDALSSDPYYANRVLWDALSPSLAASGGQRVTRIADSLARDYLDDPRLQSRPYFQLLTEKVGVL